MVKMQVDCDPLNLSDALAFCPVTARTVRLEADQIAIAVGYPIDLAQIEGWRPLETWFADPTVVDTRRMSGGRA